MALSKKPIIPQMDISAQLDSMNSMNMSSSGNSTEEVQEVSRLKEIPPASPVAYATPAEYARKPAKAKKNDNSTIIGFKISKEAKSQYQEFFANFGMNLSEASKNALEYFVQDLQKGKIQITLTHHFERVEE